MQRRHMMAAGLIGLGAAGGLAAFLNQARSAAADSPGFDPAGGWLNTSSAEGITCLRGKVTLLNFWTYSCINVLRTLPYLRRWHAEYEAAGLQIIGVHTPEFDFEHLRANVAKATAELGLRYPVVQDNRYLTWRAWNNRAWPAFHLLDRDGAMVQLWEGEGHSVALERRIRDLLALPLLTARRTPPEDADLSRIRSPEVYFGALHPTPQEPSQQPQIAEASYVFSQAGPRLNRYELEGTWMRDGAALILRSDRGRMRMSYSAAHVHLVAAAATTVTVVAKAGASPSRSIPIQHPQLYTVVDGDTYGQKTLEVEVQGQGLRLYSATFG